MAELFQRYLNVGAGLQILAPGPILEINNIDGEGLLMEWEITRTNTSAADTGTVRVYNLSVAGRQALSKARAIIQAFSYKAVFSIGWDGDIFEVLRGQVSKITPEVRTTTDVVTEISFGDGILAKRDAIQDAPFQLSQTLWIEIFRAIVSSLPGVTGLAPSFSTVLSTSSIVTSIPNFQAVLSNDAVRDMDTLVSSLGPGYDWGIQDEKVVLWNAGVFSNTTPPQILAPNTGLLSWAIQDDGGMIITSLAHPSVKPGQQVLVTGVTVASPGDLPIESLVGGGPMRVEKVVFTGSTRDESIMAITARKIDLL